MHLRIFSLVTGLIFSTTTFSDDGARLSQKAGSHTRSALSKGSLHSKAAATGKCVTEEEFQAGLLNYFKKSPLVQTVAKVAKDSWAKIPDEKKNEIRGYQAEVRTTEHTRRVAIWDRLKPLFGLGSGSIPYGLALRDQFGEVRGIVINNKLFGGSNSQEVLEIRYSVGRLHFIPQGHDDTVISDTQGVVDLIPSEVFKDRAEDSPCGYPQIKMGQLKEGIALRPDIRLDLEKLPNLTLGLREIIPGTPGATAPGSYSATALGDKAVWQLLSGKISETTGTDFVMKPALQDEAIEPYTIIPLE